MKQRILVLYYSQTGQLRQILDSLVSDIKDSVIIDYATIEPVTPFPFPWTAHTFFDAMPETVERIPIPVKPLPGNVMAADYDLIVFGYQPWFLNPSQPINSFLKSGDAAILKNKPVLTVVGSRNMWLHAQEKVKSELKDAGANLAGNIVFTDTNTNLVSLLTIIRWSFSGKKEASKFLPEAGVQTRDITGAKRFGKVILQHLISNDLQHLHEGLMSANAITLNPGLVLLEQRGIKQFRKWAKFIREKGGPGDPNRAGRVKLFKNVLLTAIFILSPLSSLAAFIKRNLKRKSLMNDVIYFKGLSYEAGRI